MKNRSLSQEQDATIGKSGKRFVYPICIQNLPNQIKKYDLEFLFSLCGKIQFVKILSNTQKCYGFVNFAQQKSALKALKYYNGKKIDNVTLKIVVKPAYQQSNNRHLSYKQYKRHDISTEYEESRQISQPKKHVQLNEGGYYSKGNENNSQPKGQKRSPKKTSYHKSKQKSQGYERKKSLSYQPHKPFKNYFDDSQSYDNHTSKLENTSKVSQKDVQDIDY